MASSSLHDPKYIGGFYSAKGHDFEVNYVLSQLPHWLSDLPSLKSFRQEGWSDVELFFEPERRWLIQIKDHTVDKSAFKKIVADFITRESSSSGQYEQYIIVGASLADPLNQIQTQLERFRDSNNSYSETELVGTRVEILKTLTTFVNADAANFIIEKVYLESGLAWIKNEDQLRGTVIGQLVDRYKIRQESAKQYFLGAARLVVTERGHLIELASLREALRQKQIEEHLSTLSQFDLINSTFLDHHRVEARQSYFYDGARPTWSDIIHQRDVPRDIATEILLRTKHWDTGKTLIPILAEAGEGKSTLLRRIAKDLADDNKIVLYHKDDASLANTKEIEWIAERAQQCIYVFFDDAPRVQNFSGFITALAEIPAPVVVFAAARPYQWKPISSFVYSANLKVVRVDAEHEYSLTGLTDHEMEILFRQLADSGLIKPLTDEDLRLAIKVYGARTKRKFLILVLELTRGERVQRIIEKEIEHVREMGQDYLDAYRYICLMASVGSYITMPMLKRLFSTDSTILDLVQRLPGLIERIGERISPRHDRIGEIATEIFYEHADEQRGDALCKLISIAFSEGQIDVIESMNYAVSNDSIPSSQIFRVVNHLLDEAYCAKEFDLFRSVFDENLLDVLSYASDPEYLLNLLANKTPLIWEQMIFGARRYIRLKWDSITKVGNLVFSWPNCSNGTNDHPEVDSSPENALRWAEVFELASVERSDYRPFFIVIIQLMYTHLAALHPDRAAEFDFRHGEFLQGNLRFEDAIRLYNSAIENDSNYAKAHAGLAMSLYMTGDYEAALRHYQIARSIDRMSIFQIQEESFGNLLEGLGELEELIEYLKDHTKVYNRENRFLGAFIKKAQRIRGLLKQPAIHDEVDELEKQYTEAAALEEEYSEEEEQKRVAGFDRLLQFAKTLSEDEKNELGRYISRSRPRFGELRRKQ